MKEEKYQLREKIDLDEWSGAHVEFLVGHDGTPQVRVSDMVGDAWHDHIENLRDAFSFQKAENTYRRNRAIQNSLRCLISHLEGIVSGMYRRFFEIKGRAPSVLNKAKALEDRYSEQTGETLPEWDKDMKFLRDLLVHPFIERASKSGEKLSQGDIFEISLEDLQQASIEIDQWLGLLCEAFDHRRAYDTESISKQYVEVLVNTYRKHLDNPGDYPPFDELDVETERI